MYDWYLHELRDEGTGIPSLIREKHGKLDVCCVHVYAHTELSETLS